MIHRTKTPGAVRRALIVAASIAGLLLAGSGATDAATVGVAAVNFHFQPESRTVKVGDTVRWTFKGDPHTVTSGAPGSPDGRFDSGIVDPGGRFEVRFVTAGTYRYFCQIHPEQMTGTIVVTAEPTPTPQPTASPTPRPTPSPTARPTPKPTPTPTPKPTAPPTARPTATATATARPTATRTAAAPATPSPTAAPTPTASASAPPTATPSATSTGVGGAPSPSPSLTPDTGQRTTDTDPLPIVFAAVVLGVLLAGGVAFARRSRGVT